MCAEACWHTKETFVMTLVQETTLDGTRLIEMTHPAGTNAFGIDMERAVIEALLRAQLSPEVKAVVLTGGVGRSFSVGGDFNEVKNLTGGDEVDRWIDRVTDLYLAALRVDKPTVAAVDGYAIGIGFQLALMFDYCVMSQNAELRMPELKHGIGCSMGGAILRAIMSLSVARKIVFGCQSIGPDRALEYGIADQVVPPSALLDRALAVAAEMASLPETAFRNTKRFVVEPLVRTLLDTAGESKRVHRAAFQAGAMQAHFRQILGDRRYFEEATAKATP
jgi:carboxymethylproline synthase